MKKRKIKRGDLLPWFLEDHSNLPAWYIKDCQEFFEWLKQSNKDRRKLNWHLFGGTPNFTNMRQIVAVTKWRRKPDPRIKAQATSVKHQATSLRQIVAVTIWRRNPEASSNKPQASRLKLQAPSALKYFSISLKPWTFGSRVRPPDTRFRIQEPS